MKASEVMDLVNEAEDKFPVDQWVIDGVHIWPLVRIKFSTDLLVHYNLSSAKAYKSKYYIKIKKMFDLSQRGLKGSLRFLYAYLKDHKKNIKPNRYTDAIFLSDGISYTLINGVWCEKFCDPLITCFTEKKISCFLMSPLYEYFVPRHTPSYFMQHRLDFIKIKNRILSSPAAFSEEHLIGFEDFIDFVRSKRLPIAFPDLPQIKSWVTDVKSTSRFYKKILKKTKAVLGFTVCYYGHSGMAFNLACHELGIQSIDVQHGVQGDLHRAYGRWNNVQENGYELLPSTFLCWGDYEASVIKKWSAKVSKWHAPVIGGNLSFKLWQQLGDDKSIGYYDKKIADIKSSCANRMHVLYTLSGYEGYDKLAQIAQLIKEANSLCYFWIRLHPCYLGQRQVIKQLLDKNGISNAELDMATDLRLFDVLKHVAVHVTDNSSTVIEAAYFGIPSVVTSEYGVELFPDQVLSGWALPAYTDDSIISAIQMQFDKKESLKRLQFGTTQSENEGINTLLDLIKKRRQQQDN